MNILHEIKESLRAVYCRDKRRRLTNEAPTILSNNCIAGMIYHDLGLRFDSPTINLWITPDDFLKFVCDLESYADCELEETFEEGCDYPIGLLKKGDDSVKIHFMHYKSFQVAKEKWMSRMKRIHPDNIYIILEHPGPLLPDSSVRRDFAELKYPHKILITGDTDFEDENMLHLDIYDETYFPGKLLTTIRKFGLKKYMDAFDYVAFLNRK